MTGRPNGNAAQTIMGRTMEIRRNAHISILKLVSACFVVFIHIGFPGKFGEGVNCVARFAVPVFLMISGYYSYGADVSTLGRRLKKIVLLIIVSNGIYFLWDVFHKMIAHESLREYCARVFTVKKLAHFVFMGENPFAEHLWYLLAMALVYVIMMVYKGFYGRSERINYGPLYIVAVCGFMIQIAFGVKSLGVDLDVSYILYRYCLFFALPLFSLGVFVHEYRERIAERYRFSRKKAVLLILIGLSLSLVQCFGIGKVEMPLGMLLVVVNLFLLAMDGETDKARSRSALALIGCTEICSTVVYVIHPLISKIVNGLQSQVPLLHAVRNMENIYPLFVLLFSILSGYCIAFIIYRVKRSRLKRANTSN